MSRPPRRRGQPRQVGGMIRQVLGELGLEAAAGAARIAECWPRAVGPAVAEHSRPVQLRGRTLEVEVDAPVWAQQLQLQQPLLLESLRELLGDEAPTDLRFRVGYPRTR